MQDVDLEAAALKHAAILPKEARWPLSFKITSPSQQGLEAVGASNLNQKPKKRWWSYLLYRGPNNERVKILYSKTKADSEILAKQFLGEKVVGFDMEWPWDDWKRPNILQNKIGLIQVATEDKIALFHIGLHLGRTTDDIIAPSLRKLIESPTIGKIGVGILNADFARLSKFFKLKPKGAVELSHLHRLVTFGGRKPELVSTKMTSLAHQVQQHLGHPLYKGDVRTSNWSKPLSQEQIKYAAGDAYAGIMLYHCLNYKRLLMNPIPPLPIHADKYLAYKLSGVSSLYLESSEEGGKIMTSAFFFGVPTAPEDLRSSRTKKATRNSRTTSKSAKRTKPETTPNESRKKGQFEVYRPAAEPGNLTSLDSSSLALHNRLAEWRTSAAAAANLPESRVVMDKTLLELARERPLDSKSLLKISFVSPKKEEAYGKQIIDIISSFAATDGTAALVSMADATSKALVPMSDSSIERRELPTTPVRRSRRKAVQSETPDASLAFARPPPPPPPPRTPQLHTGLSFILAETNLVEAEDSDDSIPSIDFGLSASRSAPSQKRKRTESPAKPIAPNSSQKLQQMIQGYRYEENVSEHQAVESSPRLRKRSPKRVPAAQQGSLSAKPGSTPPPVINAVTMTAPLTPQSSIFRNKLVAFSRFVATKTHTSAESLVSSEMLEAIARQPPRTHNELRAIPGIERFFLACVDTDMDLLAKIQRFAPPEKVVNTVIA
ncbi:3'-5' exonuclease [Stagonosporopsis vannaccii]|nr:3'-5' exonuclease [Stagonosporopsis vannaccii]